MAVIPAMFTVSGPATPLGAQVMTVTDSLEPPVAPGRAPQPLISDAPSTALVRILEKRGEMWRRHPVMGMNISGLGVTAPCAPVNAE
ncbi:hypothetical protein [Streptomyces sp. NPDC001108]